MRISRSCLSPPGKGFGFFTDEDIYGSVAAKLRGRGFDAVSTPEANRLGETDESQLAWAVLERRVLLTFNVAPFAHLHAQWLTSGWGPRVNADDGEK